MKKSQRVPESPERPRDFQRGPRELQRTFMELSGTQGSPREAPVSFKITKRGPRGDSERFQRCQRLGKHRSCTFPSRARGRRVQTSQSLGSSKGEHLSPEGGRGFPKRACASRLLAEASLAGSNMKSAVAGGFRVELARFAFWPKPPWPIRFKFGDDDDDNVIWPKRRWSLRFLAEATLVTSIW